MNMLFYIDTIGPGGAEHVISNLANQFSRAKNRVTLVVSFKKENQYRIDSKVNLIFLEEKNVPQNRFKKNVSRVQKLRRILINEKPNIIISFLPEPNFRIIVASFGLCIPKIISVRNDPNVEYKSKAYKAIQSILYRKVACVVFQTKQAKEWFPKKIQERSAIIMNQVDNRFFEIQKNTSDYYCAIGRLTEQKNYKLMIDAFSCFLEEYPDEKLYIYGEGDTKEVEKHIRDKKCENNIFLMGVTDDVATVLSNAKAFIMTSDYEGMPNALLEAMAVGVPVISTDCPCGGPAMVIINNKNGILFSVDAKNELVDSLKKLNRDNEWTRKLGEEAKETAEMFRPSVVFEKWDKLALRICENDKHKRRK